MNIGILGYGKEGRSAEKYFAVQGHKTTIFDNFQPEDLEKINFDDFEMILRSPSVHPLTASRQKPHSSNGATPIIWTSVTKYFFDHCPCPIIGVTGTKGKGTTCSLITSLLENLGKTVYLVGNIGRPAIDILDQLAPSDVVVYELSSFQLWDLDKSPHIAVITTLEPDHLNVHDDYEDYINAKSNIAKYQTPDDYLIYHLDNPDITKIAETSSAHQIAYPCRDVTGLSKLTSHLSVPGQHNQDNAEAALFAVACILDQPIDELIKTHRDVIIQTFQNFQTLPHRLEFLRELNGVRYYDDNFSTTPTSLRVAVEAFPSDNVILILGGRDKTDNQDLPEIINIIQSNPQIKQIILIGESGRALKDSLRHTTYAETLPAAVALARKKAECFSKSIVLMSPSAASFDMFKDVYDRGAQFQSLVKELK